MRPPSARATAAVRRAERDNIMSSGDGLVAHGPAFGVDGVLALHPVVLFEHGEDLKVVAPGALANLAGLVHANNIGQVRGQGVQQSGRQQVVAPM
eukprot:5874956-Pleurochrysis_carterae.AAC.2